MLELNELDYLFFGILAISTFVGLMRGFFRELFSLASWILALWLTFKFCEDLSETLHYFIHSTGIRLILSVSVLFLGTFLIGALASRIVARMVTTAGLAGPDRLLGGLFGVARGTLLIAVLILVGRFFPALSETSLWKHSIFLPYFSQLEEKLKQALPMGFLTSDEKPVSKNKT